MRSEVLQRLLEGENRSKVVRLLTVTLNDKLIINDAQLAGIPRQGPLALQLHPERKDCEWGASLVQFRNIRIKELGSGR